MGCVCLLDRQNENLIIDEIEPVVGHTTLKNPMVP